MNDKDWERLESIIKLIRDDYKRQFDILLNALFILDDRIKILEAQNNSTEKSH